MDYTVTAIRGSPATTRNADAACLSNGDAQYKPSLVELVVVIVRALSQVA
jgi:hypothetical protein